MSDNFTVNSDSMLDFIKRHLEQVYKEKKWFRITINTGRTRTPSQNNAIHKYCRMVADALNECGLSAYIDSPILKTKIEVAWTMEMVKEIWHTTQFSMFPEKPRTTKSLERNEVSMVYDVLNRAFIERTNGNVSVIFPSIESTNGSIK